MVIPSIPKSITYREDLVVDGEIICTLHNFEKFASTYKNPRNFAAGSIRLLEAKECAERGLTFVAWEVKQGYDDVKLLSERLENLSYENFTIVPYDNLIISLEQCVENLKADAESLGYPIDGCVFKFNDIAYGDSLGSTAHHFRNAIAYKFYDETYTTHLTNIEWTMGRTGVLTPVAIFEPLDIDGSTVERASVHNISVMHNLFHGTPWVGQKIEVFKANMIIPQIYSAEDVSDALMYPELTFIDIPDVCPVCGGKVEQVTEIDSTVLQCTNPMCSGKLINILDHFCGKKGLDIKGLSKATLEKLTNLEWVCNYIDLFNLGLFRSEWVKLAGFGPKSVDNILNAIESSRNCELAQFIAALGIPLIGTAAAKELVKYFPTWNDFITAVESDYHFYDIDGFGYEMHSSLKSFDYYEAKVLANDYLHFNSIDNNISNNSTSLNGLTFVITGKLAHFKNRDEIKDIIEKLGGKVTGSVSKNTDYLINNDVASTSSKNKTAQSLNIPIISETTFIETFGII
jgi:DNA ligase (NAD+)